MNWSFLLVHKYGFERVDRHKSYTLRQRNTNLTIGNIDVQSREKKNPGYNIITMIDSSQNKKNLKC